MRDELIARVAPGSRVVGVGARAAEFVEALRAHGCDVTVVERPADARGAPQFDVAVVAEFREEWRHPAEMLYGLRAVLGEEARVIVSRAGTGPAAVRVTVYGESAGEAVAPVLDSIELDRHADRAIEAVFSAAGFRASPGTPGDAWVVATATERERAGEAQRAPQARLAEATRLEHAETETARLRAFASGVLERQRRLHEELARLRAAVTARDEALTGLRDQLDVAFASTALARERAASLDAARLELAEARATIADLEARRARLTDVVVELRERITAS